MNSYTLLFWIGVIVNAMSTILVLPIEEITKKKKKTIEDAPVSKVSWKEVGKYCIIRSTDGLGMGLVDPMIAS